jgi:hypothetical protein
MWYRYFLLGALLLVGCEQVVDTPVSQVISGSGGVDNDSLRVYYPINETSGSTVYQSEGTFTTNLVMGGTPEYLSGSDCVDGLTCLKFPGTFATTVDAGSQANGIARPGYNLTMCAYINIDDKTNLVNNHRFFGAFPDGLDLSWSGGMRAHMRTNDNVYVNHVWLSSANTPENSWDLYCIYWNRAEKKLGGSINDESIVWDDAAADTEKVDVNTGRRVALAGRNSDNYVVNVSFAHWVVWEKLISDEERDDYIAFASGVEEEPPSGDSCTYSSGDHTYECSDSCVLSENVNADMGANIIINGTGNFHWCRFY